MGWCEGTGGYERSGNSTQGYEPYLAHRFSPDPSSLKSCVCVACLSNRGDIHSPGQLVPEVGILPRWFAFLGRHVRVLFDIVVDVVEEGLAR